MKATFKMLLLLLCLVAALLLNACQTHVDKDPWPASDGSLTATDAPANTGAPDASQPTREPGGSEEPGLNG